MAVMKQTKNLLKLFENQELCDTTFIVGEQKKEIKTHRLLLASISPVFKAMLFGNMRESEMDSEIEIIDVDPDAFELVVKYAYCSAPLLSARNIIATKQIADKYQISLLSEMCDRLFNIFISPQNICFLLHQSLNLKLESYVNIIQQKLLQIASNTSAIIKSNGFLQMNQAAMKIFLQSDCLNIKEEQLWEAVLEWADYQILNNANNFEDFYGSEPSNKKQKLNNGRSKGKKKKNSKKNKNKNTNDDMQIDPILILLQSICPYIRFGLMDGKYFVKKIKPLNILTLQDISDILCFIQCNDEKCGRFSIKQRAYSKPSPKQMYIPYSVNVSVPFAGVTNNYANLVNCNLVQGCAAMQGIFGHPWIKATFAGVYNVTQITIASADPKMEGAWGVKYFQGCVLQYKNDRNTWVDVMKDGTPFYPKVHDGSIYRFNINVETKALRVLRKDAKYLGIGHWQIVGFPKQK